MLLRFEAYSKQEVVVSIPLAPRERYSLGRVLAYALAIEGAYDVSLKSASTFEHVIRPCVLGGLGHWLWFGL